MHPMNNNSTKSWRSINSTVSITSILSIGIECLTNEENRKQIFIYFLIYATKYLSYAILLTVQTIRFI
jgi:hypothetical protein